MLRAVDITYLSFTSPQMALICIAIMFVSAQSLLE